MKITISKKEWDNLGNIKKTAGVIVKKPVIIAQVQAEQQKPATMPRIEEKPFKTFICTSKIDADTTDLELTISKEDGTIVTIVRTGPEARAEEVDIIDDIQAMKDKNDMDGLKRYLVMCEIMNKDDKLIKE